MAAKRSCPFHRGVENLRRATNLKRGARTGTSAMLCGVSDAMALDLCSLKTTPFEGST
jgi:hypothetical protein